MRVVQCVFRIRGFAQVRVRIALEDRAAEVDSKRPRATQIAALAKTAPYTPTSTGPALQVDGGHCVPCGQRRVVVT
jgi:hypothetical protein